MFVSTVVLASLCQIITAVSLPAKDPQSLPRKRDIPSLGQLAGFAGIDQTFDYVVVGGGTAGIVVAERLSEDPTVSVALVEAGTFYEVTNPVLGAIPGADVIGCGSDPSDTNQADWNFSTTPQPGSAGRSTHYARGKCLGGSSARNFMIYQRPTVGSMQKWADQVGDQSFAWNNVLPSFQKSAKFTPPDMTKRAANASALYDASSFSSTGGPLAVSYANYAQSWDSYLGTAFNQIGMPTASDFNKGTLNGVQYCASTIDPNGEVRASSEEAFLTYAKNSGRLNLKVFDNTLAKKILFNSTKAATGVSVVTNGWQFYTLKARKEVIVSAGAFQSPQLLMVSGIGPAATLKGLNIPVIVDSPAVGQGMQDHVFAGPSYAVNVETLTRVANDFFYMTSLYLGSYQQGMGPLTNPVADMLGWEKIPAALRSSFSASTLADLATLPADWPEVEYISGAGYVGNFANLFSTQPKTGLNYATILATLVAPFSRGNVTITSADTSVLPTINPNWLTSKTDQELVVAAFKRARAAFAAPSLQRIVIGNEYFPGLDAVVSDADILDNYKKTVQTVWHAACTCAMGKKGDPAAVIDSHARVFGVTGLRVVDASSFPFLPPGHPQSSIYMLAEKVSAQILAGQ